MPCCMPWPALQAHSPDYANMELEDFLARIENYMAVYQTMGEEHEGDMSFLKVLIATPHQSTPHHAATQNQMRPSDYYQTNGRRV